MKRLIRLAARMYPKPWGDRYGDELEALLDDMGGGGGWVAFNVLAGAILMQVRSWRKVLPLASLAVGGLLAASWWVGQRPFCAPQCLRVNTGLRGKRYEWLCVHHGGAEITEEARRKHSESSWLSPCFLRALRVSV